ncbi:hypothetical protein SUDANB95_03479 [Actinosynnema sp. ALI-1.44]
MSPFLLGAAHERVGEAVDPVVQDHRVGGLRRGGAAA